MANSEQCPRQKCGEFNMLKCARELGHEGACWFVVDHEHDYPWNREDRTHG